MSPQPDETIGGRTYRRDCRLADLGYADYKSYIGSVHWRTFRSAYWKSGLPMDCHLCGVKPYRKTVVIILHHLTYDRVGEERLDDVTPLCLECHGMIHQMERDYAELSIDDFEFLCDEVRGKRHRLEAARQRRALDTERVHERHRRLVNKVDDLIGRAARCGYDPTRHIAHLDRRLTQLEREVQRAQQRAA